MINDTNAREDMPLGLAMKFGMYPEAMKTFSNLSSAEQNQIIDFVKNSQDGNDTISRIETVMEKLNHHETGSFS